MARFPESESETLMLGQSMINGLLDNVATYPAPPTTPADLSTAMGNYVNAKNAATATQAAAEQAVVTKNEVLQVLVDDMKADLRYAENTVNYDDAKLKLIGWGGRSAATALVPPG